MTEKSIIIIGAGVAGMAAGCYARMNGYRVRIFELHDKPGGLCTAWTRKGFTFDGCIHWLVGSSPANGFHRIWRELGVIDGVTYIDHERFTVFENEDGRAVTFYTNADRLAEHLTALAPQDKPLIAEFTGAIKKMTGMNVSFEKRSVFSSLGMGFTMMGLAPLLMQYSGITLGDLAAKFKEPLLQAAFANVMGSPEFPAIALLMTLGYMHSKAAGFPAGGSLKWSRAMEARLKGLGGEIEYQARVKKINVENDRTCGVELEDGTVHRADWVISAADGHSTLFDMLDSRYLTEQVRGYYEKFPIFAPLIQVSLGVKRDLAAEPPLMSFRLREPVTVAGETRGIFGVKHYAFDPSLAPAGSTVVECSFGSNIEYWEKLAERGADAYEAEKKKILADTLAVLETRFPGIGAQVVVSDVATPLTFRRYTGNWQGSMEGWRITKETMRYVMSGMDMTLPGLKGFYMIGQWVKPGGGLPPSAQSGREALAAICRADRRKFRTTIA
jgi:phytoene dehydrogenase-like protein